MPEQNSRIRKFIERHASVQDILKTMTLSGQESSMEELLLTLVAKSFCKKNGIGISDSEIDDEVSGLRKRHRLYSAVETTDWLAKHDLTDSDLRQWAERLAMVRRFEDTISGESQVERYFSLNRLKFDEAELYRMSLASLDAADEIKTQILEGADFFGLAKRYSTDQASRARCGYMGKVRRSNLPAEAESDIFSQENNRLVGPIKTTGGYHLYWVENVKRASLTDAVYDEIVDILIKDWLANSLEDWLTSANDNDSNTANFSPDSAMPATEIDKA